MYPPIFAWFFLFWFFFLLLLFIMIGCTLRFSVYVHFSSVEHLWYTDFSLVFFILSCSVYLFDLKKNRISFSSERDAIWQSVECEAIPFVWWPFLIAHWEHNPLLQWWNRIAFGNFSCRFVSFYSFIYICLHVCRFSLCLSSFTHSLWWISRPNLSQIFEELPLFDGATFQFSQIHNTPNSHFSHYFALGSTVANSIVLLQIELT